MFEREGEHYESHYFLTFQYLPLRESISKISSLFVKDAHQNDETDYHRALNLFTSSTDRIFDILSDFMYETRWLDDSETLTYLHSCISDKRHKVSVPATPMYLDSLLTDSDLVGGLEPQLGKYHIRTISIASFPSASGNTGSIKSPAN